MENPPADQAMHFGLEAGIQWGAIAQKSIQDGPKKEGLTLTTQKFLRNIKGDALASDWAALDQPMEGRRPDIAQGLHFQLQAAFRDRIKAHAKFKGRNGPPECGQIRHRRSATRQDREQGRKPRCQRWFDLTGNGIDILESGEIWRIRIGTIQASWRQKPGQGAVTAFQPCGDDAPP